MDKITVKIPTIKYFIELSLLTSLFLIDEIIINIRFNTIINTETTKNNIAVAFNMLSPT